MRPLEGIRVVELGTHVAAPMVGRLMADWGADVIKVEPPKGEAYRTVGISWKLPNKEDNNPIMQVNNANKRSISLNLKDPDAKEALIKLLETADVFVTNTRSQALERLGLGYKTLKERCPRLIYCVCTAFGMTGPDRDGPGFDTASYWGRGGMPAEWTVAENVPARPHPGFGDATVASAMLAGVLACLYKREKTGEGDFLTSSLYGTALWYNFHGIVEAQYPGHDVPLSRYGAVRPLTPVYKSQDGKAFFIIEQFYEEKAKDFWTGLGLPEFADDPAVSTYAGYNADKKKVIDLLDETFAKIPYAKIDEVCAKLNMVHAVFATPKDALTDPQAWENNYLRKINLENGDELIVPTTPVQFDSFPEADFNLLPHLGIHTREVLKSIGSTDEQVDAMVAAGAINTLGN